MDNFEKYGNTVLADYPDVLTIPDLHEILKISEKTIYKLLRENTIPGIKIGGKYLVVKIDLVEFLMRKK